MKTAIILDDISTLKTSAQLDLNADTDIKVLHNTINLLQSLIAQIDSYIYIKDLGGRYTYINQNLQNLFALDYSDIIGNDDSFFYDLSLVNDLVVTDNRVLAFGETIACEESNILKGGNEKRVYWTLKKPVYNQKNEIIGLCGVSTDITERKAADQRLKESELRWKFALESGGDGVWDWDLENDKIFLSERCMEILGFTEQDKNVDYRHWKATIHPDDLANLFSDLQAHFDNHTERFYNEHRIKQADKQWCWIQTRGLVVARDAQQNPIRMIGTQTDIHERKLTQWLQLQKIVNGSPEAMLLVMENGQIKLANLPAANVFLYPLEDLIGRSVEDLVPHAARNHHAKNRSHFVDENKARAMSSNKSLMALRSDGTQFPAQISLTPFDINNQRAVIVSILDMTELKRFEHEMSLMAMVYQAIGDAVMVANANNIIIAINDAFTRLTGYSEQEAIGQNTGLLKSGKHDPDFYQSLWHSLMVTGHWQGEIWNKRKNGEIYQEWLVINTIYGQQGEVERRVAMFSEITQQKQIEQTMWRQANFDPLTDLANRRMFQERLKQEIKKAHRDHCNLALMLLDLDRFKEVNDTLGHAMGDILLQETARRILSCVREVDTVARLGGDEFTIILGELNADINADRVAQAILQKLSEPFQLGDELAYVSVSIGITIYPQDAINDEQLIKNADQAMYTAKQQGRNRYSYFTAEMEKLAIDRMRLTNDLRQAIINQEFRVFYQPIYALDASQRLIKAEALIRWQHPVRGMISPADFIPLAEETGLIIEIGNWLFREAVRQVGEWRERYQADFKISINQSPVQFIRNEENGNEWISYLHEQGLLGESIMIEITESLLLDINNTVREHLFAYRDAGIEIAIDDFGTGYSSLSYLKKFDIDFLKIDQSFTRNLSNGSSDLVLCEAIIVMAHKLGLKVIAEGIETQEQLNLLTMAGCDFGQGYFFSKPVPAEAFVGFFL